MRIKISPKIIFDTMWCLACNSKNLSKKRIVIIALIASAIGGALYYSATINSAITLAVLPIVLPLLGCIIMCGVMGGVMFLSGRLSKKSDGKSQHSCCSNQSEQTKESVKLETPVSDKKNTKS
jgi:hypothetical protein